MAQGDPPLSHVSRFAGVTLTPPPGGDVARAPTTGLVAFAPSRPGPEAVRDMGVGRAVLDASRRLGLSSLEHAK
jgi:hypothetical protein